MLIGALLRVPAQAIHRRIINELNEAGFEELRVPHMAGGPACSPSAPA